MERVPILIEPRVFGIKCNGGIEVTKVMPGSQAESKGVKVGWRLVEVSGEPMHSSSDIKKALAAGKRRSKSYVAVFEAIKSIREKFENGHHVVSVARENIETTPTPTEIGREGEATNANDLVGTTEEGDQDQVISDVNKKCNNDPGEQVTGEVCEQKEGDNNNTSCHTTPNLQEEGESADVNNELKDHQNAVASNGKVTLKYEMYSEQFQIENGSTTAANIDEEYALTFVMPNCKIHLSKLPPEEMRLKEGAEKYVCYVPEQPEGVYQGLEANQTYYVYIHQDTEQEKKDREQARRLVALMHEQTDITKDDQLTVRFAEFIDSNSEAKEAVCNDWTNRYEIARKYGWNA